MKSWALKCGFTGLLLAAASAQAAASLDFKKAAVPFMEKYCYDCHGGKSTKADLDLKAIKDDKNVLEDHKMWRGVLQQVNSGEMPPKKAAHKPTPEEIEKFNNSLTESFTKAEAKLKPDPGHVTVRRLNRVEYNNTVRDLTQVDYFPAENFPADDIGHGFDNIGDVLSISPVHLERYLDAAEGIAQRAVFLTLPKPNNRERSANFLGPRYGSENSTRPMTNAEPDVFYVERFEKPGDYVFRVRVRGTNAPGVDVPQFALLVDDKEVGKFTWDASETNNNDGQRRSRGGWRSFEVPLTNVSAGEHRFVLRYLNQQMGDVTNRMLYVNGFQIVGPADTRSEFMKRADEVAKGKPPEERIQPLVEWFVSRAFRRPATKEEAARYVRVFQAGQSASTNSFEAGMQQMVKTVLCSPKFLFRTELDDRPKTKDAHPLDEYQLASRLSYFLWCTMPDDELLELAAKKQLTPNLDAQVRRMLKDPRAESLVKNFGLQWLQLQRLISLTPDPTLFPGVDDRLKRAMLRETELFLGEIVREDRSVLDLIDADFTYLNRSLARHYGIEDKVFSNRGDSGRRFGRRGGDDEFVRVTLPDKSRGGLLTQASILTVTSNPTRTSPVKRGKWVLEQILGTPPPPAPPGVSELDEQHELKGSLRQRMEQHRANPACANCHQQMDAMGFAFENFDAVGRFRSKDGNDVIDPSGTLPDGQAFQGAGELKSILKGKKDLLARNVTEKLMIYALGRGLEYYDERTIKQVVANMGKNEYKFSTLVTSIVQSDPFRLRRGKELKEKHELGE